MTKSKIVRIITFRNKILFEFLRDNLSIIIIVGIFAVLGLWISSRVDSLREFGQNFVSEMLGVLITILIINQLIVYRDEKRKIPHKFAVYDDIRLFVSSYILFWLQAHHESVPEEDPDNIYEFFSDNGMGKIWLYLHLNAIPKIALPCTWYEHLMEFAEEFKDTGDKILTRHASHLPPHIYRIIHQITESHYLDVLINMDKMNTYYEKNNIPKINVLEAFAVVKPSDKDYAAVLALYDWCEDLYKELSDMDKTTNRVSQYIPGMNKQIPPPAMIPKEQYERESAEWSKYIGGR